MLRIKASNIHLKNELYVHDSLEVQIELKMYCKCQFLERNNLFKNSCFGIKIFQHFIRKRETYVTMQESQ